MKKYLLNKYTLTIFGIIFLFLLWFLIYLITGSDNGIFPSPIDTIKEAFTYFGDAYIYKSIWGSLSRMLIAFSIASISAIILGVIVGNYIKLKYVFNPTMVALKTVPTAALVFLFLILAGLENAPMYVVAIIVFPIVYEATVSGYTHIDEYILMSLKVDGNNSLYNNIKVKFPLSIPYIGLGLISSFALSFKIEIMAEVISGSSGYGLGRAIQFAYTNSTDGLVSIFAYAFIAILVMLIVSLLAEVIKKLCKTKDLI